MTAATATVPAPDTARVIAFDPSQIPDASRQELARALLDAVLAGMAKSTKQA